MFFKTSKKFFIFFYIPIFSIITLIACDKKSEVTENNQNQVVNQAVGPRQNLEHETQQIPNSLPAANNAPQTVKSEAAKLPQALQSATTSTPIVTAEVPKAVQIINQPQITFIELGSVKCIPCKMMQPIMNQIEEKYKEKVKVIFYDVWTAEGEPFGAKYGISAIPTQIFLDMEGKEFFRHQGFYPFEEIVKLFEQRGVK